LRNFAATHFETKLTTEWKSAGFVRRANPKPKTERRPQMAKMYSHTRQTIRKIRHKSTGAIKKIVLVKPHTNKINRKPRKK
jgi:hypothetical protein